MTMIITNQKHNELVKIAKDIVEILSDANLTTSEGCFVIDEAKDIIYKNLCLIPSPNKNYSFIYFDQELFHTYILSLYLSPLSYNHIKLLSSVKR